MFPIEISKNVGRLKKATPYVFGAALALTSLINPRSVSAQETSGLTNVYPQCGAEGVPSSHTVMVYAFDRGDGVTYHEYDLKKKAGECGNPPAQLSSMVAESILRSQTNRPDVLSEAIRPLGCPEWAVGFTLERVQKVDGIDFEPSEGSIVNGNQQDVRVKVHTDLLSDGAYFTTGKVQCKTPDGFSLPAEDTINFGIIIKP